MIEELAKKAYEQFSRETRLHKDVGLAWEELPEMVREAWENVVRLLEKRTAVVCNACKSLFGAEV